VWHKYIGWQGASGLLYFDKNENNKAEIQAGPYFKWQGLMWSTLTVFESRILLNILTFEKWYI